MDHLFKQAATAIQNADVLFISAGAGMGVDSGLPDFRGNEGFWQAYPLLKEAGLSFMDLANPQWFQDDPSRAWGFYGHRYNLYQKTTPHAGFSILQKWATLTKEDSFVFTSNVDGHFQKAGFATDSILECHGSINHLQCQRGCTPDIWQAKDLNLIIDETNLTAKGKLPRCPSCNTIARPNILMFGDFHWLYSRTEEQQQLFEEWKNKHSDTNIVTIEMGAGKAIPTVRQASNQMPGTTIRLNPRDADGNDNTISIPLGALEALNKINAIIDYD